MKKILLNASLIFIFSLGPVLSPIPVYAKRGFVTDGVEWAPNHPTYIYVFKGTVSCQGQPCPNAKILVTWRTDSQADRSQETIAATDGSYEMKVAITGNENESAVWTLVAHSPNHITADTVEIHGSAILTLEQDTIVVQRPLQLAQL